MQPLKHTPLIPLTPDQMLRHQVILTVNLPLSVMVCYLNTMSISGKQCTSNFASSVVRCDCYLCLSTLSLNEDPKVLQAAIAVLNYLGAQTSSTATPSQQEVDDVASTETRISEPSMYLITYTVYCTLQVLCKRVVANNSVSTCNFCGKMYLQCLICCPSNLIWIIGNCNIFIA